jgi:hypothetical protein
LLEIHSLHCMSEWNLSGKYVQEKQAMWTLCSVRNDLRGWFFTLEGSRRISHDLKLSRWLFTTKKIGFWGLCFATRHAHHHVLYDLWSKAECE